MRPIWTLDSESDPFSIGREPQPFLWGVFTGFDPQPGINQYYEFRTPEDVASFLEDKNVIVYAHNGGKFDYMSRLNVGTDDKPSYDSILNYVSPFSEVLVISGRLARFNIGLSELRDSWNILPVPLAAYKKDKVDYDIFEKEERHKPHNWKKIREYLKSDCINLHELVTAYIQQFGLNITQASGAMKFWKKLSGQSVPKYDSLESAIEHYSSFKKYYFGGRVQAFEKGDIKGKFTVADITSAYPFAMQEFHPFGLDYQVLDAKELRGVGIEGASFYDVRGISRGAFPIRADDGGLDFPVDDVERLYHVTGWELKAALDLKLLSPWHVEKCTRFKELNSFKGYIAHFWDMRRKAKAEGDRANDLLAKLAMNSLYGKFASDPRNYGVYTVYEQKYSTILMDEENEKETGERFAGFIGPWCLSEKDLPLDDNRTGFYNVATSASITGYVRAHLLRAMMKCKRVLYCDTDSIAAMDTSALTFGKELGQWTLEGTFDRAAIAGKKLYAYRYAPPILDPDGKRVYWKVRSKGVRLSWQEIVDVATGGEVEYSPQVPTYSVHSAPRFTKRKVRLT